MSDGPKSNYLGDRNHDCLEFDRTEHLPGFFKMKHWSKGTRSKEARVDCRIRELDPALQDAVDQC